MNYLQQFIILCKVFNSKNSLFQLYCLNKFGFFKNYLNKYKAQQWFLYKKKMIILIMYIKVRIFNFLKNQHANKKITIILLCHLKYNNKSNIK